jgi:[ribosomal protein S5]-alanine N-acetyltransferase
MSSEIKFDIFIKGELIDLVVLTTDIVEKTNWYKWFNDEENTKHMQKHYFSNTKVMQLKYLQNVIENNTKLQLGVVQKEKNCFCGVVSLNEIDYINSNTEISLVIGEKKYHNLQIAYEAVKLIINHAFFTLNLHKICGGYIENLESWGTFLKRTFGFIEEGVQNEQIFKNGKYMNVVIIGLTINQYRNCNKENFNEK